MKGLFIEKDLAACFIHIRACKKTIYFMSFLSLSLCNFNY